MIKVEHYIFKDPTSMEVELTQILNSKKSEGYQIVNISWQRDNSMTLSPVMSAIVIYENLLFGHR